MKTREPTHPILRTYIKAIVGKNKTTKYKALVVNVKTDESLGCTKDTIGKAVDCVRQRVGIR